MTRETSSTGMGPFRSRRAATELFTAAIGLLWLALGAGAFARLVAPEPRPRTTASSSPAMRPVPLPPAIDRVLIIVVDALRADIAQRPELMPTWRELAARGAGGVHRTGPFPVSASFYKAFFAGRAASLWDVYNDLSPEPRTIATWLDSLAGPKWFAGPASGYAWLHAVTRPGYVWQLDSMENIPRHDRRVVRSTAQVLRRPASEAAVVVAHLASLDAAAHRFGGSGTAYRRAATEIDRWLHELVSLCSPRTLTILVSDHGVRDDGGHSSDGSPEVSWAPFAVAGPVARGQARDVRLDQTAWPFVFASWLGLDLPPGYAGLPNLELLSGYALRHGRSLLKRYASTWQAPVPPVARIAPSQATNEDARSDPETLAMAIQQTRARVARFGRALWAAWVACGFFLLAWLSSPLTGRRRVTLMLLVLPGAVLVAAEKALPPVGRVDGFAWLDELVPFRASGWLAAPVAAAGLVALAMLATSLARPAWKRGSIWSTALVLLLASVTAPLRLRNDLLLYVGLGVVLTVGIRSVWRIAQDAVARGNLAWMMAFVAVVGLSAAVGQKLSYRPLPPVWQQTVTAATAAAALVVGLGLFRQSVHGQQRVLALWAAIMIGLSVAGRFVDPAAARIVWWAVGPFCVAEMMTSGAVPLVTLYCLALLTLPCPQQWAAFAIILFVMRPECSDRPVKPRDAATVCAVAGLAAIFLFHFSDGRDLFLPVNALYRGTVGAEVVGGQFSMALAAAGVWSRYVLVVLSAVAAVRAILGPVPVSTPLQGLMTLFAVRLTVNAAAFAIYGVAAWNYHLALLFNDAMFMAAAGVLCLAAAVAEATTGRCTAAGSGVRTRATSCAMCSC